MKDEETEFLNKLFIGTADEADEFDTDFPLLEVPDDLSEKLYSISSSTQSATPSIKQRIVNSWPTVTSIAASILVAVVVFQLHQQQQTLKQLEQAQADLATALHYLGEANKITQVQLYNSVNTNMQKAAVAPVVEISRGSVIPNLKPRDAENSTPPQTRSL